MHTHSFTLTHKSENRRLAVEINHPSPLLTGGVTGRLRKRFPDWVLTTYRDYHGLVQPENAAAVELAIAA